MSFNTKTLTFTLVPLEPVFSFGWMENKRENAYSEYQEYAGQEYYESIINSEYAEHDKRHLGRSGEDTTQGSYQYPKSQSTDKIESKRSKTNRPSNTGNFTRTRK